MDPNSVKHPGRIVRIDDKTITVQILSLSACASCHAKGACHMLDIQEKFVEVERNPNLDFSINEEVEVSVLKKQGMTAVVLSYIVPFILLISGVIVVNEITHNELLAGGTALGMLALYFVALYSLRHRFKESFQFKIYKKINESSFSGSCSL